LFKDIREDFGSFYRFRSLSLDGISFATIVPATLPIVRTLQAATVVLHPVNSILVILSVPGLPPVNVPSPSTVVHPRSGVSPEAKPQPVVSRARLLPKNRAHAMPRQELFSSVLGPDCARPGDGRKRPALCI
jgi:hypothetical protein